MVRHDRALHPGEKEVMWSPKKWSSVVTKKPGTHTNSYAVFREYTSVTYSATRRTLARTTCIYLRQQHMIKLLLSKSQLNQITKIPIHFL